MARVARRASCSSIRASSPRERTPDGGYTDTDTDTPNAWSSLLLGRVGSTGVKVLRMDGRPMESESHDTAEALLVVDGTLQLVADDIEVEVRTGEMCIVEAGVEHAVNSGSRGTLVILEHISNTT